MFRTFLVATFAEEESLLKAVGAVRSEGFKVFDVYAPYPVHGLDEAMGIRPSRIPWVTFAAGLLGLLFAVGFQFYVAVFDWPMNVGGKPDNSTLAFVPIAFEMTVLSAGLATAGALLFRARLFPGARARVIEAGVTDHVFAVVLRKRDATFDSGRARKLLEENGARRIHEKEADLR